MTQSFLDTLKSKKKGFLIINNRNAYFANDSTDIQKINFKKLLDDFIFGIHEIEGLTVRSYSLDESSSAILVLGKIEHTDDERKLLKRLLYKAEIIPTDDVIQSIIPKRNNWNSITISEDLKNDLTELIESEDAKKIGITNVSQIITATAKEFLLNFHNKKRYRVQSKMKDITLEYTIIGRFVFCNICSLHECEHVDLFFKEPSIREDVEKQGIRPIRYSFHEGEGFLEKDMQNMVNIISKNND